MSVKEFFFKQMKNYFTFLKVDFQALANDAEREDLVFKNWWQLVILLKLAKTCKIN